MISYFASASNPADNSGNTTSPTAVAPPADMQPGDLCFFIGMGYRSLGISMSETGGQTWNAGTFYGSDTATAYCLFWAIFNGTWSANPSIDMGSATTYRSAILHIFRPTGTNYIWEVDVAEVHATYSAPSSPYTVTIAEITTNTDNALVVASWLSGDINTWDSLTAGWTVLGDAQYRNNGVLRDGSFSFAYIIQASAGATGAVSKNQATLGGDAGRDSIIAFKEVLSHAPVPVYMNQYRQRRA